MSAIREGDAMNFITRGMIAALFAVLFVPLSASAQDSSIYVQCPTGTILHPGDVDNPPLNSTEFPFAGAVSNDVDNPPTSGTGDPFPGVVVDDVDADPLDGKDFLVDPNDIDWNENGEFDISDADIDWNGDGIENVSDPDIDNNQAGIVDVNDAIKCKHLMAGDGMVTMADGRQQYIFSFADVPMPGAEIPGTNPVEYAPTEASGEYPNWVMDQGIMAANAPAPTISVDEDDELFLTLTNVGMAMRPDLFDPHTVHWHGFPQAAPIFDGLPDASVSINMGASLSYYYNAKDAGTYMYHCHVEATEHMQMGMLGNLFVRPRQNKLPDATPLDHGGSAFIHATNNTYAYNDGDGSTLYDVEYPIQMGSFDPEFHDASLNVQPLPFADMRDRYFMLNGRGYPDTVKTDVISTVDPLGLTQPSQPVSSLITAMSGQRILLRISNLNITEFYTLGTNGLSMEVVALDARLLRDGAGNNMYYKTNSLTLGGGQSADVIIDTTGLVAPKTFFLYTKNLDRLANNDQNFGGMMTEIRVN